jgi:hypothetical protein
MIAAKHCLDWLSKFWLMALQGCNFTALPHLILHMTTNMADRLTQLQDAVDQVGLLSYIASTLFTAISWRNSLSHASTTSIRAMISSQSTLLIRFGT